MDTKEKHDELPVQEAEELKADAKREVRKHSKKVNRLWLWLGVLILIFILLWWLWTIGTFEDVLGTSNNAAMSPLLDTATDSATANP